MKPAVVDDGEGERDISYPSSAAEKKSRSITAPIPNLLPVLNPIMPPPPPPPPSAISPMTIETANAAASAEALKEEEEEAKKRKVLLEERKQERLMLRLRELRKKVRAQRGEEGPGSSREKNNKFDFFNRDPSRRPLSVIMERRVQIMQAAAAAAAAAQPNYDHGATIDTTTPAQGNQPNLFNLITQQRD